MHRKSFLAVVLSLGMILQSVPSVVYAGEDLNEDNIVQADQTVTEAGIEEVHRVLGDDSGNEMSCLEEETNGASSMTTSEYDSKMNAFVGDSRWKNGISWTSSQSPKISSGGAGCVAYSYDWVKYMFGLSGPAQGSQYTNASQISTGDVVRITGHTFVVLKRTGDKLYTAEGAVSSKVRVSDSAWWISNGSLKGNLMGDKSFEHGYHYVDLTSGSSDTTPPAISDVKVTNLTKNGYDISCVATDNVGVTEVSFPTWTDYNDQDDILWKQGSFSNGRWSYHVSISDHNNERGVYLTHIYAYDAAGNSDVKGEAVTIEAVSPVISDVRVENQTKNGYDISCVATDNKGVTEVVFPTWTDKGGQDDLIWHKGVNSNGRWKYHVNISEHNNERGLYLTHIYAYDACQNEDSKGEAVTIEAEPPTISDVIIENVTKAGYDISCVATDDTAVTSVDFESWTVKNDDDDITVCKGIFDKTKDRWYGHINVSDHNGEVGNYKNRITAYDACQNIAKVLTEEVLVEDERKDSSSSSEKDKSSSSGKDSGTDKEGEDDETKTTSSSSGKDSGTGKEGEDDETKTTSSNTVYVVGQKINVAYILFSGVSGANSYMVTNKKYASVNKKGVLKAKKAGTVVVKALYKEKGKTPLVLDQKTIRIAKKPKLKFKTPFHAYNIGEEYNLNEYLTTDGTPGLKVSGWTSSNPNVANVDSKSGKVKICGKGRTTITAHYGTVGVKGMVKVKAKLKVKK